MSDTYIHCTPTRYANKAEGNILGVYEKKCISRPTSAQYNANTAIIGYAGSMKTHSAIKNTIIGAKRRGESMLICEPRLELFKDTAAWLHSSGYTVRVLNLTSLDPSNGWNFLEDALRDCKGDGDEIKIVEFIVDAIFQSTGTSTDKFWEQGERCLLKSLILQNYYLWKSGSELLSFNWAYYFLLCSSIEEMKTSFGRLNRLMPMNAGTHNFNIFLQSSERAARNIQFGLLARLSIFTNKKLTAIVSSNEMSVKQLTSEKCAFFIEGPMYSNEYASLAKLYINLLYYCSEKDTGCIPVNVIIDDLAELGTIPSFSRAIAVSKSRRINATFALQSIPQLYAMYGEQEAHNILDNMGALIFMGTHDLVTAEHFSKLSKLETQNLSLPESASSGYEDFELMRMSRDESIVYLSREGYIRCKKFNASNDPESKKWIPLPENYAEVILGIQSSKNTPVSQPDSPESGSSFSPRLNRPPIL